MKLTKKSEYACMAMIDLSKNYNKGFVRIGDISKRKKIPKKYLEQILLLLKSSGYLMSMRGPGGGYRLSKPPCSISVAEILEPTGGSLASIGSASNEKLIELFGEIGDCIVNKLEKITFANLIEE